MIDTLYSFDFDGTLCFSPEPIEGKKIWLEKTKTDWPYVGWWGKAETLDSNIFYVPKNEWVYKEYLKSKAENNSYTIMATGRLEKVKNMRKNVETILNFHNMSFDEVHLNTLGDTFRYKVKLFENLINKTKCKHFIMYDDRYHHLVNFEKWAKEQSIKITIIDVKNKTEKQFNI